MTDARVPDTLTHPREATSLARSYQVLARPAFEVGG